MMRSTFSPSATKKFKKITFSHPSTQHRGETQREGLSGLKVDGSDVGEEGLIGHYGHKRTWQLTLHKLSIFITVGTATFLL